MSGTRLAFVSGFGEARILDVSTGKAKTLGPATAVALYQDGSRLAVLHDAWLAIWRVDHLEVAQRVRLPAGAVNDSALYETAGIR